MIGNGPTIVEYTGDAPVDAIKQRWEGQTLYFKPNPDYQGRRVEVLPSLEAAKGFMTYQNNPSPTKPKKFIIPDDLMLAQDAKTLRPLVAQIVADLGGGGSAGAAQAGAEIEALKKELKEVKRRLTNAEKKLKGE